MSVWKSILNLLNKLHTVFEHRINGILSSVNFHFIQRRIKNPVGTSRCCFFANIFNDFKKKSSIEVVRLISKYTSIIYSLSPNSRMISVAYEKLGSTFFMLLSNAMKIFSRLQSTIIITFVVALQSTMKFFDSFLLFLLYLWFNSFMTEAVII